MLLDVAHALSKKSCQLTEVGFFVGSLVGWGVSSLNVAFAHWTNKGKCYRILVVFLIKSVLTTDVGFLVGVAVSLTVGA